MTERSEPRWLLLLHQIPRKPDYLRVKVWRRLQRLGAVSIKNAVYALPRSEERNEDLQWVMREITAGGGEATLVEANLVQGLRDDEVEALFNKARDADYEELVAEIRAAAKLFPKRRTLEDGVRRKIESALERAERRLEEISAIDFFHASSRETASGLLEELRGKLAVEPAIAVEGEAEKLHGRTWVTRKGIHVDRMASAWLIRRFIDKAAKFKWVPPRGYMPEQGELRFDMFEAEFTHVGNLCSFEVLMQRTGLKDRALQALAEIVHDIDIKDDRYQRRETAGVASLVAGIALTSANDDERLARASAAFDQLYEVFARKRGA
ncbi:MAG: chromate resistance protein [Myxococcales bacterium]|nr:chromate resistance protein [Myxococcales bacterium]